MELTGNVNWSRLASCIAKAAAAPPKRERMKHKENLIWNMKNERPSRRASAESNEF